MPEVTVIADDLTGAADCGIVFAVAGLATFVAFGEGKIPRSARIVSVDIDSRWRPQAEAVERAHAAAREAYRQGSRTIYKKIDSTLRGHVGPELAATFQAAAELSGGKPVLIACPAFPGTGRTMRDGRVLVNGTPLEETEVWRKSGMTGPAELAPMLRQAGLRSAGAPIELVRSGPEALARALAGFAAGGAQAVVCDSETEDDLRRIAGAGARLSAAGPSGHPVVWVGSAGLARHLPAALELRPAEGQAAPAIGRARGPVLTLCGSRSTVAREQARLLAAEPGVDSLVLEPELLLRGESSPGWPVAAAALDRSLQDGRDVLLLIGLESVDLQRAAALAAALARFAAAHAGRIGGLVATGGDIARAILGALGAAGLHLLGEVEPGVPFGLADTDPPLPVITKAGAFGTPATLQRCRAALRRLSSGEGRHQGAGSS